MVLLNAKADPNATFNDPMMGAAAPPLVACFDSQRKLNMPAALDIAAALIAAKAGASIMFLFSSCQTGFCG